MDFIFIVLFFILTLIIILLLSNVYYRKLVERQVVSKLDDISQIFETGSPPKHWHNKVLVSTRDIQRLDKLIVYLKRTRLVFDEETREEVLKKLTMVRNDWALISYRPK